MKEENGVDCLASKELERSIEKVERVIDINTKQYE